MDPRFRVNTLSCTPNPQQTIYAALHQDYSEGYVYDQMSLDTWPDERRAGEIALKRILGGELHAGPLEHAQIVFNVGWFPHSVMQQARTHRIASFDVQSMRYTGQRIVQCAEGTLPVEEVFYLRPEGYYTDRKGHKYHYTDHQRNKDLGLCMQGALRYAELIEAGYAEEHARGILPFDYRQHFIVSLNMRSLGHLLTIRGKRDAQLEIQQMCQLMLPKFEVWAPEIYSWFETKQWQKGRLAL